MFVTFELAKNGRELGVNPDWVVAYRQIQEYHYQVDKYFPVAGHILIEYGQNTAEGGDVPHDIVLGTMSEVAQRLNGGSLQCKSH